MREGRFRVFGGSKCGDGVVADQRDVRHQSGSGRLGGTRENPRAIFCLGERLDQPGWKWIWFPLRSRFMRSKHGGLDRGLRVFVEKRFAPPPQEVRALLNAPKRSGVMVSHKVHSPSGV